MPGRPTSHSSRLGLCVRGTIVQILPDCVGCLVGFTLASLIWDYMRREQSYKLYLNVLDVGRPFSQRLDHIKRNLKLLDVLLCGLYVTGNYV